MVDQALDPKLPQRIARLNELAKNLWWSWHPEARNLFRNLDYPRWKQSYHNPVKQLRMIDPVKLRDAAKDPGFLELYDSVIKAFDEDVLGGKGWFAAKYPVGLPGPIAYFSAEFAIHTSLPIYAGGLGVLAGDICKEASDLGLPFVGVGLMYPQGYFHQHINPDGWQEEIRNELNFDEAPISRVLSDGGQRSIVQVQMDNRTFHIGVWLVRVGNAKLYLMDTDVEENPIEVRQCASCLYASDRELRIQQEIILGIGGVRVLKVLGIKPSVWHANEGHTAFMMIERVRQKMEEGMTFDEASRSVRESTVFTTHTPVPSGHDVFSVQLIEKYLGGYLKSFGIGMELFLGLGRADAADNQSFNMTAFALHMAEHRSAVSALHGQVTRKMWHSMWPDSKENKVPISHVTNGIHIPTWVSREFDQLFDTYLGKDWLERQDDPEMWAGVLNIPDKEFWEVRQLLKDKLIDNILERAQKNWADGKMTAQQVLTSGVLLHPRVLTIGFARRFTDYKRATLLFHDLERFKTIVRDGWKPVQIVFAGKSHPDDQPSKQLLRRVYEVASNPDCLGRIVFIEDYDIHLAHYITQGVDVWLNTPRRLNEACGTSGMKASMNGVPHLSVRDGWWHEGYNGKNGWAIGGGPEMAYSGEEDKADVEALYRLLEEKIVPLYYDRDRSGLPLKWIAIAKAAISSTAPSFCARRMMREYIEKMYTTATKSVND